MSMMTSQSLRIHKKTQKSKYLETEIQFFLQIKNFIQQTLKVKLWQKMIF